MSNHHRATPAQWATAEKWAAGDGFGVMHACLLELRARVEALEAAALGRHGKAADSAAAPSLVDRVALAIFSTPGSLRQALGDAYDFEDEARAAIREVAEWLDERNLKAIEGTPPGDPCGPSEEPLAVDAIRWLRYETNR